MRKEAQKAGSVHLCESDAASLLGLSLEQLWIRLQPQERIKLVELWKTVSAGDWKPRLRLAFLRGNLTAIKGSVVPQVTS